MLDLLNTMVLGEMHMALTREFRSKAFHGHSVYLKYNADKHVVRIACPVPEVASEFLARLIIDEKISAVDTVIFSRELPNEGQVVHLIRGDSLTQFLRDGVKTKKSAPEQTFTQLVENAENS
jgi:hypothetical protein